MPTPEHGQGGGGGGGRGVMQVIADPDVKLIIPVTTHGGLGAVIRARSPGWITLKHRSRLGEHASEVSGGRLTARCAFLEKPKSHVSTK